MSNVPEKAYKNLDFLNSAPARHIRILCEYEETRQRFLQQDVQDTVVFFGSARCKDAETAQKMLADANAELAQEPNDADASHHVEVAEAAVRLSAYYEAARELARRFTAWNTAEGHNYLITSGGGPGIMEAANRGAADVDGGRSIGLGISLPFEESNNKWVTPELSFEFHYFFMRKLWFLYPCKALVIFPGGFGTMDELFETMTLIQTKKIKRGLPIVLFGASYWSKVFNPEAMADFGTISRRDLDLIHWTDDIDEALDYLTGALGRKD
jgi:uncharacterized protein (TIGR00730 family)